jgi:hypothetical protein
LGLDFCAICVAHVMSVGVCVQLATLLCKGSLKLDTTTTTISQNKYSLGEIWQKHLVKKKRIFFAQQR